MSQSSTQTVVPDPTAVQRRAMIDSQLRTSDVTDPAVIAGFSAVDRAAHVPAHHRAAAYADRSIPLGNGRALNPPLTTARLILALGPVRDRHVLLIGGATGYAAAILSAMGARVTVVENDPALLEMLHAICPATGITIVAGPLNVGAPAAGTVNIGTSGDQSDPAQSDPAQSGVRFDALMIDGAVAEIPAAIVAQIVDGGPITTGIDDRGVTRLARSVNIATAGAVRPLPFADMECVILPGFAPRPRFSF